MGNKRSTIHSRLRHESLPLIAGSIVFSDGTGASVSDFESATSRFNAFAKRIGYQAATADAAAFYSMLKAEVLFADYDGTMDVNKIFRGPLLLIVRFFDLYASVTNESRDLRKHHSGSSRSERIV
jgi:hypothetical protein